MTLEKDNRFGYWHDPLFVMSLAAYFINRELISMRPMEHLYACQNGPGANYSNRRSWYRWSQKARPFL
jgi:hypothetical protein